ncbi:MAG: hypothetical protein IKQ72_02560 [Bacteroidaceae bacterium]|nr:hypothetical protein [Bacteroidaceae bacterium]
MRSQLLIYHAMISLGLSFIIYDNVSRVSTVHAVWHTALCMISMILGYYNMPLSVS